MFYLKLTHSGEPVSLFVNGTINQACFTIFSHLTEEHHDDLLTDDLHTANMFFIKCFQKSLKLFASIFETLLSALHYKSTLDPMILQWQYFAGELNLN